MRTWTGCLTCRSRKVKCDERRPKCRNCEKSRLQCTPSDLLSFKHWRNPSVRKTSKNNGDGVFELDHVWVDTVPSYRFVDETSTITEEYEGHVEEYHNEDWSPGEDPSVPVHHRNYDPVHSAEDENVPATPLQSTLISQANEKSDADWDFAGTERSSLPTSPCDRTVSLSEGCPAPFTFRPLRDVEPHVHLPGRSTTALDNLFDNLPINTNTSSPHDGISQRQEAAGQALILMANHDFETHIPGSVNSPNSSMNGSTSEWGSRSITSPANTAPMMLTSKAEADLLRKFSDIVGTWMDLSDLSETFSKKVCRLGVQDPLLKAASIACAAKQQYLVGKMEDGMQIARKNYDTAISLLINRLSDLDEPYAGYGFAAIVICSCYEMLDAPTADWQRHLDGVFSFGRVQRVNGSSGGIAQAAFWSIARQEVVCAIINSSKLRLDPDFWVVDLENIGQEGFEDLVNNQ
ncbi:hypothetical protein N7466_006398 [Penicillium verhagenii]|uniref:uncharacterized protein n=1 Tax=Penicillium verhagenii TaxID=1562060 RepID=UPI00254541A1|nr:uncharacterized protein N7466_006398 [Penicillium verhagenii]KAJ5930905.1 hypothetical protein N7466_006398 [Penicillium verhagenii]